MPSHRGAGEGLDEAAGPLVDVRERPGAPRPRSSWPNTRAARPELAARGGRRSALTDLLEPAGGALPSQRSATAVKTPPDGLTELAALLGLPGQRSAPPSWAADWSDGMPASHPSAPVPSPSRRAAPAAPVAPSSFAGSWPTTDEIAALEAPLRRRRRAASLPADGAPAGAAALSPAAPSVPSALAAPSPVGTAPAALAPPVPAPAELPTRRSRRAAQGPVDLQPRSVEPARPGSRRALRERQAQGGPAAVAPAPAPAEPELAPAARELPSRSDTDVLAELEALLAAPAAPAELDLRTDPLFPGLGWTRHRPDAPAPADLPADLLADAPADAPVEQLPAPRTAAPWSQPVEITPVVLAPEPAVAAVAEALLADTAADTAAGTSTAAFAPRRGRGAHRLPRRVRVALPHVAVVSALGVATLVAPLVGTHLRAEADTATGTTVDAGASTARAAAAASAAGAADLVAERASQALALSRTSAREAALQATTDRAAAAQVAAEQALALQEQQLAQQKAEQEAAAKAAADHQAALASLVGQCSGDRPDVSGTRNGRLTDGQMCDLWVGGHQLRSDAAVAFAELNLAYREHFGKDIVITDSYRSYAAQVAVKRKKPGLAAVPGTSEHGWGLAVDLGDGVQNSDEHYDWLIENAPRFGWDHPAWARKGGGGPYEPWHWEYVAGE